MDNGLDERTEYVRKRRKRTFRTEDHSESVLMCLRDWRLWAPRERERERERMCTSCEPLIDFEMILLGPSLRPRMQVIFGLSRS